MLDRCARARTHTQTEADDYAEGVRGGREGTGGNRGPAGLISQNWDQYGFTTYEFGILNN